MITESSPKGTRGRNGYKGVLACNGYLTIACFLNNTTHRTLLKHVKELGYFLDELNAYSSDCRLPHGILFSGLRVSLSDLSSTRTTIQTLARGLKWGCLMRRLHYAREILKRRFVLEENSGSEIT